MMKVSNDIQDSRLMQQANSDIYAVYYGFVVQKNFDLFIAVEPPFAVNRFSYFWQTYTIGMEICNN